MRVAVLIVGSVLGLIWAGMTAIAFVASAASNWHANYMIPVTAAAVAMCLLWLCGIAAVWNAPRFGAIFFAGAGFLGIVMSDIARNLGIAGAVALVLAVMSVVAHYQSPSAA
jgi:hypothetical protein